MDEAKIREWATALSGRIFLHDGPKPVTDALIESAARSLLAEQRERERDAERYRWLREQMGKNRPETWRVVEELAAICCYTSYDDFDAAIDAARKAQGHE